MKSFRAKPTGWQNDSTRHSLAAKGIVSKKYASVKSPILVDPVFYAQKREESVSFSAIMDMVKSGDTVQTMSAKHPAADPEDLRKRGIKALESREGTNTLSTLDKQGIEDTMRMAKYDPEFRNEVKSTLESNQKCSYMHPVKVEVLKRRMAELPK